MWNVVLAVSAAALSYLGIPANVRPAYVAGWLAFIAISLFGLCSEWRKPHCEIGGAADKLCAALGILRRCFAVASGTLAGAAVLLFINGTALHKTLILHKPGIVQYGDILDDGKDRIYVHARFNNTANNPVKFQVYGKAIIEPLSLTRIQSDKISDKLKDDVRLLVSGDDATILTANPRDDQNPTTFDIPGPVISKNEFTAWEKGQRLIYYDVLVYVKEADEMRFQFRDCEITRMIIKQTPAGQIPGLGPVLVKYPWPQETECDDTGGR
jgi:hypothetical protein